MRVFNDAAGREWRLAITIGGLERVKATFRKDGARDIDLMKLDEGDPPLCTQLELDPALRCHVIFALLRPQAVKAEIDDESFAEGLDADTVDAASRAFWEELIDFFQKLGRDDQATIVRTQQKFLIQVVKKVTGKLGAIDLDQLLANRRSESIPGESFGGSLESAD